MYLNKNVKNILENSIKVMSSSKFNITEVPNFTTEFHLKGPSKPRFVLNRDDVPEGEVDDYMNIGINPGNYSGV
jgi:hypothetical protein